MTSRGYWVAGASALLLLVFVVWIGGGTGRERIRSPSLVRGRPAKAKAGGAACVPGKWKNPFSTRKSPSPERRRPAHRDEAHRSGFRPASPGDTPLRDEAAMLDWWLWDPDRSRYEPVAKLILEKFSFADAIKVCMFEREAFKARYAPELIRLMKRACRDTEGTKAWPEAVLYKGLCYELKGYFAQVEGYGDSSIDLRTMYRRAAEECPDLTAPVARQLLLRAGLDSFLALYFHNIFNSRRTLPETLRKEARDSLSLLASQDLSGTKTIEGQDMGPIVQQVFDLVAPFIPGGEPRNFNEVRAIVEAQGEIIPRAAQFSYSAKEIWRTVINWLDGPFADDYNGFLQDPGTSAAEKARLTRALDRAYNRFHMKRPDLRREKP